MKKKEFFLLVLFVFIIIFSLLTLRFYSLDEFNFRQKLKNFSILGLSLAASSSDVNLDVNIVSTPTPLVPPSLTPTPSGSYSYSPSPSESPSGSVSPSGSPSGSASPSPSTTPGGTTAKEVIERLMLFSSKVGPYNFIIGLALLFSPILGTIFTAFLDPFASIPIYFYYLWLLLLQALGIKKKGRQWGNVYDYISKNPVSMAVVRIIDADTRRVLDTSISTKSGGFAFLTDEGKYLLKVFKSGYLFPVAEIAVADGSIWVKNRNDGHYENIYSGGIIEVRSENQGQISCNIPIEYTGESTYGKMFAQDNLFFASIRRIFSAIRFPLLIVGSFVAIVAIISTYSTLNLIVIIIYSLLWAIQIYRAIRDTRAYGRVIDDSKGDPLDLVMVRLIQVSADGKQNVIEVKASDSRGRFMMIAPSGRYYITAMKPGYRLYRSQTFEIKNERLIDFDLRLKKSL